MIEQDFSQEMDESCVIMYEIKINLTEETISKLNLNANPILENCSEFSLVSKPQDTEEVAVLNMTTILNSYYETLSSDNGNIMMARCLNPHIFKGYEDIAMSLDELLDEEFWTPSKLLAVMIVDTAAMEILVNGMVVVTNPEYAEIVAETGDHLELQIVDRFNATTH